MLYDGSKRRQRWLKYVAAWLYFKSLARTRHPRWDKEALRIGERHFWLVLKGPPPIMRQVFKLRRETFETLCGLFRERGLVKDTSKMCVEVKLAIFLYITCHGGKNILAQERFVKGGATVSNALHEVVDALVTMRDVLIPPPAPETFDRVTSDKKYPPGFDFCLGALDGTHIPVKMIKNSFSLINRKGWASLNVLVVVDFNLKFRYIYAGVQGSAHDQRVLDLAYEAGFKIPPGFFYLGDAGYTHQANVVVPYRNVRYHLKDFKGDLNQPHDRYELFNLRHSSLRMLVERTIGVWKKRFTILTKVCHYGPETKSKLAWALAGLHNFLIDNREPMSEGADYEEIDGDNGLDPNLANDEDRVADDWRNHEALEMWVQFHEDGPPDGGGADASSGDDDSMSSGDDDSMSSGEDGIMSTDEETESASSEGGGDGEGEDVTPPDEFLLI